MLDTGDGAGAAAVFRRVLALRPDDPAAALGLGQSLLVQDKPHDAAGFLETAVAGAPADLSARGSLHRCLMMLERHAAAAENMEALLRLEPDLAEAHNNLGNIYREIGEIDKARACLERATELQPDMPQAHNNLGSLYTDLGRVADAKAAFRRAIGLRDDYAMAYRNLVTLEKHTAYSDELHAMEALYAQSDLSEEDLVHVAFGLGKAFADLGEHARAFRYWAVGNRTQRRLRPYSVENDIGEMEAMQRLFTADYLQARPDHRSIGPQPIFVVGMPRSGTSLTEQILASHSQVHGAGELETVRQLAWQSVKRFPEDLPALNDEGWRQLGAAYLDEVKRLAGGSPIIVDKLPRNFIHIGIIRCMLPAARIVHIGRDPMDTCLSCFQNYFYSSGMAYTTDQADLGRYYRQYEMLMEHWRASLQKGIFDMTYEDLVADTENRVRKLLDFCELDFEATCLDFHKTERRVATASATQVREPIHARSVGRWRNYEKFLGPLIGALE